MGSATTTATRSPPSRPNRSSPNGGPSRRMSATAAARSFQPARIPPERINVMHGPAIVLDQDQADDLRELIDLAAMLHEWLLTADDRILDDLAVFAYRDTIHPRSYVDWLTEDIADISARLPAATNSSCDPLDTSAFIGNQIPPSRP